MQTKRMIVLFVDLCGEVKALLGQIGEADRDKKPEFRAFFDCRYVNVIEAEEDHWRATGAAGRTGRTEFRSDLESRLSNWLTVSPMPGWCHRGAISCNGIKTNARTCARGWGIVRAGMTGEAVGCHRFVGTIRGS